MLLLWFEVLHCVVVDIATATAYGRNGQIYPIDNGNSLLSLTADLRVVLCACPSHSVSFDGVYHLVAHVGHRIRCMLLLLFGTFFCADFHHFHASSWHCGQLTLPTISKPHLWCSQKNLLSAWFVTLLFQHLCRRHGLRCALFSFQNTSYWPVSASIANLFNPQLFVSKNLKYDSRPVWGGVCSWVIDHFVLVSWLIYYCNIVRTNCVYTLYIFNISKQL